MVIGRDIRIWAYLFLETLNGDGLTIEQRGMQEADALDMDLTTYAETLSIQSGWLQEEFFTDQAYSAALKEKASKLQDPVFAEQVKAERTDLADIHVLSEKFPLGSRILPAFAGVLI